MKGRDEAAICENSVRVRITGRVQGVGYRVFVAEEARRLGLNGWVRNRTDGTVEAVVSGDKTNVDAFVAACRRGPSGAKVQSVSSEFVQPPDERGFRLLSTL